MDLPFAEGELLVDNNSTVNFDDYIILEANFGTGTAVPEPMTLSLLGLGAVALIRRK